MSHNGNDCVVNSTVFHEPDEDDIEIFGRAIAFSKNFQKVLHIKHNCPSATSIEIDGYDDNIMDIPSDKRISAFEKLGGYLGSNTHVQQFSMTSFYLGSEEMVSFCEGLRHNRSIQRIDLRQNSITATGLQSLAPFAVNNPNLQELDLGSNFFGNNGVNIMCQILRDRHSRGHSCLKSIVLRRNDIAAVGIEALAATVIHIGSGLKVMSIDLGNNDWGMIGISSICDLLSHPRCFIEEIDLTDNFLRDNDLDLLAIHLRQNSELKCLKLRSSNYDPIYGNGIDEITERGMKALLNLVCNPSTIEETYTSNHTITSFGDCFDKLFYCVKDTTIHDDIKKCLEMNQRSTNKKSIAREKVLYHHFSGNFNLEPIHQVVRMTTSVLPNLLGWLARDASPTLRGTDIAVEKSENGSCFLGEECPLSHDSSELFQQNALAESVRPDLVNGTCHMADNCRFNHEMLEGQTLVYDKAKLSAVFRILKSAPEAFKGFERRESGKVLPKKRGIDEIQGM